MDPELVARRLAERRLHLITTDEAKDCGLSQDQLKRLVARGRFERAHVGVYRTGPRSEHQDVLAACLAAGREAVASHRSAAFVWDLLEFRPPVEVTVPRGRRARGRGSIVHRAVLLPRDRTTRGPIPVTTVPRTLMDLAGAVGRDQLEAVVDTAILVGRVSAAKLWEYVNDPRFARSAGSGVLRRLVADRRDHGVPESELEREMLTLLRRFALPQPLRQLEVVVRGRRVRFDLAYPDDRVAIELDGRAAHLQRDRWQSDHHRHNATELSEWLILRFTWWDVKDRPIYVAATVADALGMRPTRWRRQSASLLRGRTRSPRPRGTVAGG